MNLFAVQMIFCKSWWNNRWSETLGVKWSRIPFTDLRTISKTRTIPSLLYKDLTEKLRKMVDKMVFSSRRANLCPAHFKKLLNRDLIISSLDDKKHLGISAEAYQCSFSFQHWKVYKRKGVFLVSFQVKTVRGEILLDRGNKMDPGGESNLK